MIACSFLMLKLLTPRERTRPSCTSASIASHVSRTGGCTDSPTLPVTGQWICTQASRPPGISAGRSSAGCGATCSRPRETLRCQLHGAQVADLPASLKGSKALPLPALPLPELPLPALPLRWRTM